MGCNPFGKLISKAFGGRGKRRRKRSRQERCPAYPPPLLPQQVTSQSMARTIIYKDEIPIAVELPVHTVQTPEPVQETDNPQLHHHHPLPEADILPSHHARAAAEQEAAGYAARGDMFYQPQVPELQAGAGAGAVYRYPPSPVPSAAWGEPGERRREYFGGEYRYCYPTPMREGIYGIATDANRLTTMFSDENPNACRIV